MSTLMHTLKKIDIHAHIVAFPQWTPPHPSSGYRMPSPEELIGMYDQLDIERGVLLPIVAAEGQPVTMSNEGCVYTAEKYPDRFSWFCNVDPRALENASGTPDISYTGPADVGPSASLEVEDDDEFILNVLPMTGDDSPIVMNTILAILSVLAIVLLILYKRYKESKDEE